MSYDARREVKEATRVGDTFIFMTLSDHCPYLDGLGPVVVEVGHILLPQLIEQIDSGIRNNLIIHLNKQGELPLILQFPSSAELNPFSWAACHQIEE